MPTQQENLRLAQAFGFRVLYESVGLSGFSPKATAAMSIIDCAKSDSKKGFRVAKSIGHTPQEYDYAFKLEATGEDSISPDSWTMASGPEELCRVLGEDTNITFEVAKELIQSAAIVRTYKKLEQEGLASISEKSGYFQYIQPAIINGSLRRIGQGDTGSTVAEADLGAEEFDPDYDPSTAPGKSLPELLLEKNMAAKIQFDPLAALTQKIAVAHQEIRIANEIILQRANDIEDLV